MKRTTLILLSLIIFRTSDSFTQNDDGSSRFAGEPFSTGVSARGLAMGSAFSSINGGTASLWWNPAGLTGSTQHELLVMHSERFGGEVNYNFFGYSQPLPSIGRQGTLGIGLIRLGVPGIDSTAVPDPTKPPGPDNRPFTVRTLSVAEYEILISYGQEVTDRFQVGGTLKILHSRFDVATATGFGFDVGVILRPQIMRAISLGINVQDVTTTFLAFTTGKRERIRPTLRFGLSNPGGIEIEKGRLILSGDTSIRFEDRGEADQVSIGDVSFNFHFGGEYLYRELVALRGGLDEGNPTFGAGVILGKFNIDYAWLGVKDLDQTNRISLSYSF